MSEFLMYFKNLLAILSFRTNREDLLRLNSKMDTAIAIFCVFLLVSSLNHGLALGNLVISTVIFGGLLFLSGPLFSNIFYLAGVGTNLVLFLLSLVIPLGLAGTGSLLFFVWQLIAYFVAMSKIQRG